MSQISCVANASITKLECNTFPLLTLEELKKALVIVQNSHLCRRTPMLYNMQDLLTADATMHLHLKMESMQSTGSFKVRGLANQLANLPDNVKTGRSRLITMSGGNYGKAFAYALSQMGLKGLVVMPTSVPTNRIELIEGFGMEVELVAKSEMMVCVNRHVKENGMTFLHSFDDPVIIAGHSSIGFEILEDCRMADIIVCAVGGGGILAGLAAAIKLSGHTSCRLYGVEPTGSQTMYQSFQHGCPVAMPVKTIASGLAPPFAGQHTFLHCRQFVDDIVLVADEEIISAMWKLYDGGLKVEPSGAAALAAVLTGKIPDVSGKNVVVVVSGGNVTLEELCGMK